MEGEVGHHASHQQQVIEEGGHQLESRVEEEVAVHHESHLHQQHRLEVLSLAVEERHQNLVGEAQLVPLRAEERYQ